MSKRPGLISNKDRAMIASIRRVLKAVRDEKIDPNDGCRIIDVVLTRRDESPLVWAIAPDNADELEKMFPNAFS